MLKGNYIEPYSSNFAQFTGSTGTRRALAELECFRKRWLRCVRSSQLLLAIATGREDVRSWQLQEQLALIMTSDRLREQRHISERKLR